MSVYISGMEMPKEQNVPTWAVIFSNGEVRIYKDGFNTDQGNGKGTAIPAPPHGDLIDRDALTAAICSRLCIKDLTYLSPAEKAIVDEINDAPVVIPADEVV